MKTKEQHSLRRTYVNMIQRCHNPNNPSWDNYGGRGIVVCDLWRDNVPRGTGFRAFCDHMGERPKNMTMERIDNDGPYSPQNCKWATKSEQARNTRKKRLVEFNGEQIHISVLSERTGIEAKTLYWRILQGWPIEKVLNPDSQYNNSESIKKAVSAARTKKAMMTHCKRGHEFTHENTHIHNGRRVCKTCRRLHDRASYYGHKL